jgi:hypothetical protein
MVRWMTGLLALVIAATAHGQPPVLVRADTRIELRVDRHVDGQVHLIGTLRDDLGAPVPGVLIDVAAWREVHAAGPLRWTAHPHTDAQGSFDVLVQAEDGWWASAAFAGTELFLGTEARQRLDLSLAHVSLTLHVESAGVLDLDVPEHAVRVETESTAGGADLTVSLRNELGVTLAEGRTDLSGGVSLMVPSALLGPPSAGRLVALSEADTVRSAAQAEVPIVRLRSTHLALELLNRDDERARLGGRLEDSSGPRARDAIGVYAGDRHLGTAATAEDGRFELEFPLSELAGLGAEVPVQARFSSDAPWIGGSESAPVVLSFRPLLLDATSLVAAGSLLALLTILASVYWLRRRAPAPIAPPAPGQSSLTMGARGRARSAIVSGVLRDARTQAPLARAHVTLGAKHAECDGDGAFSLTAEPGRSQLIVQAAGYEAFEVPIIAPHRGEHVGMSLNLLSLRDLALAPLRPIALRLLPSAELWSLWTQRELLSALRKAGREPPELGELIDRVERACYGTDAPAQAELEAIRALAARIEASKPTAPQER